MGKAIDSMEPTLPPDSSAFLGTKLLQQTTQRYLVIKNVLLAVRT